VPEASSPATKTATKLAIKRGESKNLSAICALYTAVPTSGQPVD